MAPKTFRADELSNSASKIRIEPISGWVDLGLRELWEYRELLFFLTWRDIRVRYKQTILGFAWAILQPLFTMVVFNVIFKRVAGITTEGIPYPLYSFTALVPYYFFSNSLTQGANSLLSSAAMIKKIYFPRLAVPIGAVLAGLVDFILSFTVLLGMLAYYVIFQGFEPNLSLRVLWMIPLLMLLFITSLGMGLWFSALNAQFRDVRYIVPFLSQALLFLSPIAYGLENFSREVQLIAAINPLTGVVEGFRWALLGAPPKGESLLLISTAVALILLISGAYYFRRMEKTVADVM